MRDSDKTMTTRGIVNNLSIPSSFFVQDWWVEPDKLRIFHADGYALLAWILHFSCRNPLIFQPIGKASKKRRQFFMSFRRDAAI